MSTTRARLAAGGVTAGLVLLLGNPPVADALTVDLPDELAERGFRILGFHLARPQWWRDGADADLGLTLLSFGVVLVLLVILLAGPAAKARTAASRFLAGWGATFVAAAVAGLAQAYLFDGLVADAGASFTPDGFTGFATQQVDSALSYALLTGWLTGLAVALFGAGAGEPATTPAPAAATGWSPPPPDATQQWSPPPADAPGAPPPSPEWRPAEPTQQWRPDPTAAPPPPTGGGAPPHSPPPPPQP